MPDDSSRSWETAVLVGGPAEGMRVRVPGRPLVLQVTVPCATDDSAGTVRVEALYVYRRDIYPPAEDGVVRYGFDQASP